MGTAQLRHSGPPSYSYQRLLLFVCVCVCVCVCVGWSEEGVRFTKPFQPFGEPSFLRCSGAHGPVPPCVFQMSRGSARCGVIHLPQVQTSPPQNHCQMHSYPARYTPRKEHMHT